MDYTNKLPRSYPKHNNQFSLASNTWIWILQSLWSLLINNFDVARDWKKSLQKFSLYTLLASETLIWMWFEPFFSLSCQWKRKQTHIIIFNITLLKAHCSHQFIKCSQMCIWILIMGTDETEKNMGFMSKALVVAGITILEKCLSPYCMS